MLVRAQLRVRPESERARVAGLLDQRTLVVVDPPGNGGEHPADVDLIFVNADGVDGDLPAWVEGVHALDAPPAVVCLTGTEDASRRARLLALGCVAVLNLRLSDRELRAALQAIVKRAADQIRTRSQVERARPGHEDEDLVAVSPAMRDSLDLCRRIAPADTSVLLLGETGVGKERLARSIHRWSPRSRGPFVAVNCGAIPEGLLESELFGHERGAFTGAVGARRGHFEMAHGGTLFLDEIGELPLPLQVKLLRALDQRRIQRLGSEDSMPVDIRLITATHRVLDQEVGAGRFRADLFYRLAVITVAVPPLRARPEDVDALVRHYVAILARSLGRPAPHVEPVALKALESYAWPGNVRELMNVLERAVLLCTGGRIGLADLPGAVAGASATGTASPHPAAASAPDLEPWSRPLREARSRAVRRFEREYVEGLLRDTSGRVGEAARRAGVNPRTLYDLVRRHGIRRQEFQTDDA